MLDLRGRLGLDSGYLSRLLGRLEARSDEVARRLLDPELRGTGLGGRLLRDLERRAAAPGHPVVRLDTHVSLTEAVAMYERAGYRAVGRHNDNPHAGHWFEKALPQDVLE